MRAVQVEVVATEVGEHGDVERAPATRCSASACDDTSIATASTPRVATLARAGAAARAPRAWCARPTSVPSTSADRPAARSTVADQVRRGGLAVRAGDADHRHRVAGMVEHGRGQPAGRGARVGRDDLCRRAASSSWSTSSAVAPASTAAAREVVPVEALAADAAEQPSAADRRASRPSGRRSATPSSPMTRVARARLATPSTNLRRCVRRRHVTPSGIRRRRRRRDVDLVHDRRRDLRRTPAPRRCHRSGSLVLVARRLVDRDQDGDLRVLGREEPDERRVVLAARPPRPRTCRCPAPSDRYRSCRRP